MERLATSPYVEHAGVVLLLFTEDTKVFGSRQPEPGRTIHEERWFSGGSRIVVDKCIAFPTSGNIFFNFHGWRCGSCMNTMRLFTQRANEW